MAKMIKLTKGYDIKLLGDAPAFVKEFESPRLFAVKPLDFKGITPRLKVEVGNEVKAGDVLFHDKRRENILFTAPVSGEVVEVKRGARRVIEEIKILSDSKSEFVNFTAADPNDLSEEEIKDKILKSGCWPFLRNRPFNTVPDPEVKPRDIFISCFDSAPLAPNYNFILEGKKQLMQTAITALLKLTDGKIYLGLSAGQKGIETFSGLKDVEIYYFDGPHPAGNVGVQIHNVKPINKGETVWTINPQDLLIIGRLFFEGKYNTEKLIAICGNEFKTRGYIKTMMGAQVSTVVKGNLNQTHVRIISGNVLTGTKIEKDGFIGHFDNCITAIEEGDEPEFFGWILPSYPRPSYSKTMPAFLSPETKYKVNTSMHGEERAFVITGEYEKVLPMDVLPMQLFKACLAKDIDNMEGLGIYELVEEDVALCEFICTSKLPLQEILSEGLEYVEKEA
jgi:Na+-transporting NADH:ubiquinone oxidoreductase subunit A